MSLKSKSFRRRLGRLLQRLNPLSASRAGRFHGRSSGPGFTPRIEQLESRQLLSVAPNIWVNDNWVVTSPADHLNQPPVSGDIVANTGTGDDSSVTGKIFGTATSDTPGANAFATVQDALDVSNANDTIMVLAGQYTFDNPYLIAEKVTIEGQSLTGIHGETLGGETLSGPNGVFNITANPTIDGGGAMTFTGATGSDPYSDAAIVLGVNSSGAIVTGSTFSGNLTAIGVTSGVSSFNISSDSFTNNEVGIVTAGSGTVGLGNTFNANNTAGPYQGEGIYVTNSASVIVSGNTFKNLNASGAATPGGIVVEGGSSVTTSGNSFFGNTVDMRVLSGILNSTGNDTIGKSSGTRNLVGVLVSGGSATLSHDTLGGNTTAIDVVGGSLNLDHDTFAIGSNPNATDLQVESGAGTVTIGVGNAFHATGNYINNLSSQNFDLTSNGTTFDQSNLYGISDKILDGRNVAGLGLVYLSNDALYVTPNSYYNGSNVPAGLVGTTTPSIARVQAAADAVHGAGVEQDLCRGDEFLYGLVLAIDHLWDLHGHFVGHRCRDTSVRRSHGYRRHRPQWRRSSGRFGQLVRLFLRIVRHPCAARCRIDLFHPVRFPGRRPDHLFADPPRNLYPDQ